MVDVFISYSRENQEIVRQLADAVTSEGYSVWWDAELPPHLSYGDVITEKIGSAKAAIVVWSRSAAASEWVRAEADVARGQKKLIQTSIDDVMPPMPFNQIQFASIGDWHGEADHPGWRKVKASLAALCGAGSGEISPVERRPHRRDPPSSSATPAGRGPIIALLGLLVILVGAGVAILLMQERGSEPEVAKSELVKAKPLNVHQEAQVVHTDPEPAPSRPIEPESDAVDESQAVEDEPPAPVVERPRQRRGEILPGSDSRRLRVAELYGLTQRELFLARNEIFARHGRIFRNPMLSRHFSQFAWYRPREVEVRLSPVERANVQLISQQEAKGR